MIGFMYRERQLLTLPVTSTLIKKQPAKTFHPLNFLFSNVHPSFGPICFSELLCHSTYVNIITY